MPEEIVERWRIDQLKQYAAYRRLKKKRDQKDEHDLLVSAINVSFGGEPTIKLD